MPLIRSDTGLIFQSRQFQRACQFSWLTPEDITL